MELEDTSIDSVTVTSIKYDDHIQGGGSRSNVTLSLCVRSVGGGGALGISVYQGRLPLPVPAPLVNRQQEERSTRRHCDTPANIYFLQLRTN